MGFGFDWKARGHELVTVVRIMKALVGSWDWGSEGDGFIWTLRRYGAGVGDGTS